MRLVFMYILRDQPRAHELTYHTGQAWTAVSTALCAVCDRTGEPCTHIMGYYPKLSNRNHRELSKNRLDWDYVKRRPIK
jgi:hypothetical protein